MIKEIRENDELYANSKYSCTIKKCDKCKCECDTLYSFENEIVQYCEECFKEEVKKHYWDDIYDNEKESILKWLNAEIN